MYQLSVILIAALVCSCKTAKQTKSEPIAPTPMSCIVDARIVEVLKSRDTDTGSSCYKHPCTAKVHIENIHVCGSSVSLPLNAGDTLEMHFVHTLDDTRKIFPNMTTHYPGLKKGKRCTATIEQRLAPGTDGHFIVNHYTVK